MRTSNDRDVVVSEEEKRKESCVLDVTRLDTVNESGEWPTALRQLPSYVAVLSGTDYDKREPVESKQVTLSCSGGHG